MRVESLVLQALWSREELPPKVLAGLPTGTQVFLKRSWAGGDQFDNVSRKNTPLEYVTTSLCYVREDTSFLEHL